MSFYVFSGVIAFAALALFISAIPLSYRVEARSNPARYGNRRFGYTNIWFVMANIGVARDAETQGLRRTVTWRVLAAICLTLLLWPLRMVAG